jgi:hypothetical protein
MEQDFLNLPADLLPDDPADRSVYREAYQAGYTRTLRELDWAREQGWHPTERQIVRALMQAMRVFSAVRSGKPIGGRHPAWLRGRADALRSLLHNGVGFDPSDSSDA